MWTMYKRRLRLGSQGAGPQAGFDRAPGRTGAGMPLGGGMTRRQGFGNQGFDHIAVLGVQHDQHAVVAGDPHGSEDVAIREAQAVVVGGEHLQRGDAHPGQGRDLRRDGVIQPGQVHVEGVVDGGFFGFFVPGLHRFTQRGEIQGDKIDHGGRPAKGRGFVTGVMVVRGDCAEHGQVEVRMRVHAAGEDEFAGGVDDFMLWRIHVWFNPG